MEIFISAYGLFSNMKPIIFLNLDLTLLYMCALILHNRIKTLCQVVGKKIFFLIWEN